ncbi:hypothetical protein QFC24_006109 [Naganishia onofrii]|uniref:Uncharacterized protein n=1 Tax=Naganishia onofrii TaxID=1851511 RepID=A0ACC2X3I5_9TREE|nr:hypothetical protein QFC24_006109 [Naganishia onofrii]
MSLPSSYKQGAPKDSAKRKQADDAPVPAVTSPRPPVPLPHPGLSRELPPAKCMATSQGSAPSDRRARPVDTEGMPERRIINDKQKPQMFEYMEQENMELKRGDAKRLQRQQRQDQELREVHKHIGNLRTQVTRQQEERQVLPPIGRPYITKDEASDLRLLNARETLGLTIDAADKERGEACTTRGYLKEQSWKLLLALSREVVTWGTASEGLDPVPLWKKLHWRKKTRLSSSSPWDPDAGPEIWKAGWPLRELIKSTIDNIKDTLKRQKSARSWFFKAYDLQIGSRLAKIKSLPPARAIHFTAAIQHQEPNTQDEDEDGPPEENAPKRHVENAQEDKVDEQDQHVDQRNIRDHGATEDGSSDVGAEDGVSQARKLV